MKKKRIGIFGGTFNPPHNGHIMSAKHFIDEMSLDKLLIIPTFIPPHKSYNSQVTCEERLEMCKLAFSEIEKAYVSDVEIMRGGTSYTYITLQELDADDIQLFMLCGTDMMLSIDTWKNPQIIFESADICYVRREEDSETAALLEEKCKEYTLKFGARIHSLKNDVIDISSTEIRESFDKMKENVPIGVLKYITEKGLYK